MTGDADEDAEAVVRAVEGLGIEGVLTFWADGVGVTARVA